MLCGVLIILEKTGLWIHTKNLRKKLAGDYIDTIRGVGYRIDKIHKKQN